MGCQWAVHPYPNLGAQLWNTDDVGPHTVLDRSNICHGIRRKVSEHTYTVGIHASQEQEGLTIIAGSSCSSGPCLRLARIKNKKMKPLSMLGRESGVVRSSLALTLCQELFTREGLSVVLPGVQTSGRGRAG